MSFASYSPTVTIDKFQLSGGTFVSGSEQTVFQKSYPKGTYFISFSPMVTATTFTLVTCDIGEDLGGTDEYIPLQWYGTPANYYNPEYEQISLAGVYESSGENPLTIILSATSSSNWNYLNYDGSAYNLLIMRLT